MKYKETPKICPSFQTSSNKKSHEQSWLFVASLSFNPSIVRDSFGLIGIVIYLYGI